MKIYVTQQTNKNADGDKLTVVKTYDSKPTNASYVVWVK